METVFVDCGTCGKSFERRSAEHRRSLKLGRLAYCSRACAGKAACSHLVGRYNQNLQRGVGKRKRSAQSTFRRLLYRGSRRGWEVGVTPEELEELWLQQEKRCAYTGVVLEPSRSYGTHDKLRTLSLDRIDSTKGYVKGNVQIISIAANWAKGSMTHEEMLAFCHAIADFHRPT